MERTLFVFEGEKREKQYFQSLERVFFSGEESRILVSFRNDIYELYREISSDEDLDSFELIKEMAPGIRNQEDLTVLRRDQIGQIYLFFDMEPCDDKYSDQDLINMLELFNNETEHGKLFVSYPMVEAIRDIDDHAEFLNLTVNIRDCTGDNYKPLSAERGNSIYQDAKNIDKSLWQDLVSANVRKANSMVYNEAKDTPILNQMPIAQVQVQDYLPRECVSVLSAFPIFLADYFGRHIYNV